MNLPEAFLKRMERKLGEEFPAFLQAYETPAERGIRVNTLKIPPEEFTKISPFEISPVPWAENGFYTKQEKAGADVYHFAGLYYCQEPSAMCAVPFLNVKEGERVLDLCAAPGGKSTQLAECLRGTGLLISNEYVPARAKILSENIERLGVKNCAVTSADSAKLAAELPEYFDKILVDAPCSGEGMFKKEPSALTEWSEENVRRCAQRQEEILHHAARMLAGGGQMVYSTCTFSDEENEGQIQAFLNTHPEFILLAQKRLYPHTSRGEGHFAALLEKKEGARNHLKAYPVRQDRKAEKAFSEFAEQVFEKVPQGSITTLSDGRMFLLPSELPKLSAHILRAGLELGEWNGKRFLPSHSLAMAASRKEARRFLSLSREACKPYLRGETLDVTMPNGWCIVGVEDYPLGFGKVTDGVLKNHYPKGLRANKI